MALDTWDLALDYASNAFAPAVEPEEEGPSFATPGDFARYTNPATKQTPALDLIDEVLVRAFEEPDSRQIVTMAPQEGKSVRVAGDFPAWVLKKKPDTRIIVASYGQALATRNGRQIRSRIARHPELGLHVAGDHSAAGEWELEGHEGGVYSIGVGGGITGRACDLLIIDDPIKSRSEAESKLYRDRVWDWWTDEASTRLAPGAPVVLILTRWHHDDLAGRLLAEEGSEWKVLNIPAQAEHRPEKGETDPLGREPGEFMVSARGRTTEQWEQRKKTVGTRTWASLFQGHPTPDSGNLFPTDGWSRYTTPLWIVREDGSRIVPELLSDPDSELVQSWDFTFKDTKSSDFVVGQVWLRRGPKAYLLDQVRDRMTFSQSCRAILDLSARWPQAIGKLVEDKANGPAILNALRAQLGGLIPVEPEGSKYARASAISPFVEAGDVLLPDPVAIPGTAWVVDLTSEASEFPDSANDDTVDAMSQGVHRLLLVPLLDSSGATSTDEYLSDVDEEDEALPWAANY